MSDYLEKAISEAFAACIVTLKRRIEEDVFDVTPAVVESTAVALDDVPALPAPQESAS